MKTKPQRLKYVVHYKEAPDKIQWDKDFYDKREAERFAMEITFNGGMAILTQELEEDDMIIGLPKEHDDEQH